MAIYKNCQPIPCNDDTSIREWIEANPPPVGGALPQQLDWLVGYLLAYACACGCGDEQLQTTLEQIVDRLNADCNNPLRTQVCNSADIFGPIVDALRTINLNLPPRPVLDCNLTPTGDEAPGVTVVGVVQNRPCPAPNLTTLGLTLNASQAGTIPANVKSWTVIVFEGSATINGQPNILAGTTIKGGGYSDGSRVGPIPLATNAGSRLVAYWEI